MRAPILVRNLTLLLGLALGPTLANAQHPGIAQDPTLDQRLGRADRVAWIVVESATAGRLEVRLQRSLIGVLPERFAVKRSPSAPPPLATGSHAVLMLRGARPPFILADEARLVLEVAADEAAALTEAVANALAARTHPRELAAVYQAWIPGPDPRLRTLAAAGLGRLLEEHEALRRDVAMAQAGVAADPEVGIEGRRAAALLALRHLDGAALLVAGLAAADAVDDPTLVRLALQAGTTVGAPEVANLYGAAAAHDDPQVRRAAMRLARAVAQVVGDDALDAAARLAENDPEPSVRRQAERAVRDSAATRTVPGT